MRVNGWPTIGVPLMEMSPTTGSAPTSGCTVRPIDALRLHTENVTDSSPGCDVDGLRRRRRRARRRPIESRSPAPDHVRTPDRRPAGDDAAVADALVGGAVEADLHGRRRADHRAAAVGEGEDDAATAAGGGGTSVTWGRPGRRRVGRVGWLGGR